NHPQVRVRFLERPNRTLSLAVGIPGPGPGQIFVLGRHNREQRNRRNTQIHKLGCLLHKQVDAQALHARHGRNRLTLILTFQDKYRKNQIVRSQLILTHQTAGKITGPVATQTGKGIASTGMRQARLWHRYPPEHGWPWKVLTSYTPEAACCRPEPTLPLIGDNKMTNTDGLAETARIRKESHGPVIETHFHLARGVRAECGVHFLDFPAALQESF